MVKLQELPDNFTDADLAALPSAAEEDNSLDDLYDKAAARGGFTDKSFEEALSDLSKTPLFMTSLEDAGGMRQSKKLRTTDWGSADEENTVLEALKALQYEGPKSEAAQNFKDQGNECVQQKKWSDAKEFYTKGIAVLVNKDESKWDTPEDPQEESRLRKLLAEQLYGNRARCNLELSE